MKNPSSTGKIDLKLYTYHQGQAMSENTVTLMLDDAIAFTPEKQLFNDERMNISVVYVAVMYKIGAKIIVTTSILYSFSMSF